MPVSVAAIHALHGGRNGRPGSVALVLTTVGMLGFRGSALLLAAACLAVAFAVPRNRSALAGDR
ncbi:hypothetical protein AB0O28_17070 [Microbispora sp. NPDC088329]|uniref:hypothetical protein n=1 Tax=Microbispora sp. NPDC088329 TaxID=3154869 RepID=UPI003426DD72